MTKLHFGNFIFKNIGNVSIAYCPVTLVLHGQMFKGKDFTAKVTRHKDDVIDLNKAYKILQASIEKKAYDWAAKFCKKMIEDNKIYMKSIIDFKDKAEYIAKHDEEYLKTL